MLWRLLFHGLVQGVGFRPTMLRTAEAHQWKIEIANTTNGVELYFNALHEKEAHLKTQIFLKNFPSKAHVKEWHLALLDSRVIEISQIIYPNETTPHLFITPDLSWCPDCQKEFLDTFNKRHLFMFISCAQCGARFSISQKIPFERQHTSHQNAMCLDCSEEYLNTKNSRYLSQINTCNTCNFETKIYNSNETNTLVQLNILVDALKQNEVVALKGISGFYLVGKALSTEAIGQIRHLKNRPLKPLAIMAKNLNHIKEFFEVSDAEANALLDTSAPIIILKPKDVFKNNYDMKAISGDTNKVGVMIASAGFLYYIIDTLNDFMVATSGNLSGYPIEYKNDSALINLANIVNKVWFYERDILFPQDDSVCVVSPQYHTKIVLRKSKGLTPSILDLPKRYTPNNVLCLGAESKASFCIAYENQVLFSPYLGNMNSYEKTSHFEYYLNQYHKLINYKPFDIIYIDQHPDFFYRTLNSAWTFAKNVPVVEVQHHVAHAHALLGELNIHQQNERIGIVVFDGLGYYNKETTLGAELFVFNHGKIEQQSHFPFYKYLQNNKMSLEPRVSYFSIMKGKIHSKFKQFYTELETNWFLQIFDQQANTNSMGRVVDGLAFLLGYERPIQSFEGEAALWLESFLYSGYKHHTIHFNQSYLWDITQSWEAFFNWMLEDLLAGFKNILFV